MLKKVLKFEFKSRFTNWMTLLFILMMIFQGLWYSKGYYDFYGGEGMFINSPGVCYQNLAGCGLLMVIIVAIITGPTLYKDIQYKSAGWMYSLPINDKQFFLSRFFAAFLINVAIGSFYLVGIMLVPYSGMVNEEFIGPTPWGQMLHGFFTLTIPNLFLLTSICFAALAIFKKPSAGYLAIFLTVISFLMMQSNSDISGYSSMNLTFDAFGFVPVSKQIAEMSVEERNTSYISFSGYLLLNKLLWFGIALVMLVIAYFRFSFKDFLNTGKKRKRKQVIAPVLASIASTIPSFNYKPKLQYTTSVFIKKLFSLSALEFKNIVRPTSFRIIVGILILMAILQNLIWNGNYYIGPQVPVTSAMTAFRISNGVFIIILLIIWSGELFFKDRVVNIWQITDALPIPVWVTQLSKLIAMIGVAFVINATFMLSGIASQIIKGGASTIDMGLFINDYLGYNWGWINHCFYIILAFFIAGFTGKRFLTHILTAGYFFVLLMGFEFGLIEDLRMGFGFTPGFEDYSEMNGYGMWRTASFWYFLMWLMLCMALVLLGILFWDRGLAKGVLKKLRFQSTQLNWLGKLSVPLFLAAFVLLQSFIFRQVNGKDNFELDAAAEASAVDYEHTYSYLADKKQPKYSQLDFQVDFYPEERKASYVAKMKLSNTSDQAIDTLYFSLAGNTSLKALRYNDQTLIPSKADDNHDMLLFALPSILDTNAVASLTLEMEKDFEGFSQGDPQASVVFNGSFAPIAEYLPSLGYDDSKALDENRQRVENELPKLTSLMAVIDDEEALQDNPYFADATAMKGTMTISTIKGQTPIGTGMPNKTWEENDRVYTTFDIKELEPLNWYLGTGEYEFLNASYKVKIYHKADHTYNVLLYASIIENATDFIEQQLGSYPYESVRFYEIPRYQDAVYAFNRGIAISELEGWIADTSGLKERAYLHQTAARGLVQHWVQSQLSVADVQGADMLRVALSEAIALLFVQDTYGEEGVELLREAKMKVYNKERFNDPNGEPPLLYADGKDYLEVNWGALVLYDWAQEIGLDTFSELVKSLQTTENSVTFEQLYRKLLSATSAERKAYWKEQVETVVK
ncbi:MAG: hypothetical protein AAF599_02475 [Bacteroidota bacterium]